MTLTRLPRSIFLFALAGAAAGNMACSHPQVRPRVAPEFKSGALTPRTVAVLPVDISLAVRAEEDSEVDVAALEQAVTREVRLGLSRALSRRGYRVVSSLGPTGRSIPDVSGAKSTWVLHPDDMTALRLDIHRATKQAGPGPGSVRLTAAPDLTGLLGKRTGADATLYARGWAVNVEGGTDALTIALIVIGIVLIVGLVILLLASKSKPGKGAAKAARAGGKAARPGLRVGRAMGRAAFTAGVIALRTAHVGAHIAAQAAADARRREHEEGVDCHRCQEPPPGAGPDDARPAPPAGAAGAELRLMEPGELPDESTFALAVTLVHNATGKVLWHAEQSFSLEVEPDADLPELMEHFLELLPARGATPAR